MAYTIDNPLGVSNLEDIVKLISDRLIDVVIPVAVLLYIWAGVQLLIANGEAAKVTKAKEIFKNVSLGLLVIFIGGGFVDLIRSILGAE